MYTLHKLLKVLTKLNFLKALLEAESYHGPSLIIAYAPCINHGIKGGMSIAQTEEKKAVDAGYWHSSDLTQDLLLKAKIRSSLTESSYNGL